MASFNLKDPRIGITPILAKEIRKKFGLAEDADLGIPILTPGEMENVATVHVLRSKLPTAHVPSELELCSRCKGEVWVSLTSPPGTRFCVDCAAVQMKEDGEEEACEKEC